ncbi:MAG: hypothetical protein R3A79_02310 [Nannocystaceae bacterium]
MSFAWSRADAEVEEGADFSVAIWAPRADLLITQLRGRGTVEGLRVYTSRAERAMGAGPLTVFHDWCDLDGYDPAARDALKAWGKAHTAAFAGVHYLVRSKIVMMLISVAALTLGRDLYATTDRASFDAKLAVALRRP